MIILFLSSPESNLIHIFHVAYFGKLMLPFPDNFFETFFCFLTGAAKLVVVIAIFLLTFYVISQVFEIKMDANLGHIFGK